MNKQEMIDLIRKVCRVRRLSIHTESCYLQWCLRFAAFIKGRSESSSEEKLRAFLEMLAPRSSASTQNQALNAVVFLYRDVLQKPLGQLGKWARAKRPRRLPSWLTSAEMEAMLREMPPFTRLMAEVSAGSGLRLAELLALRIKDIDLEAATITVHGGKGDKDRVTCLPRRCTPDLQRHIQKVRRLWDQDRARNAAPVYLPDGLERKFPSGGAEWPWFWMWPAREESRDPRTGIVRRHHVHENTLGKALKTAAQKAGIIKRVTAHTLRHSFATSMIMNGADVKVVQELMGHSSIETTAIYLHCLPALANRVVSPLDHRTNVVPFIAPSIAEPRRISRTA